MQVSNVGWTWWGDPLVFTGCRLVLARWLGISDGSSGDWWWLRRWGQSQVSLIPQKAARQGFRRGEQKLVRPRDHNSQLFHGSPVLLLTEASHKPYSDSKGEEASSTSEAGIGRMHHIVERSG